MPQPRELTRLRAPAMGRATVMATLVALLVAAAAVAVLADARSSGVTFWGTSFVVMGSIAVSGVAATALALLVHARDAVVGRWALFAAGSVLLYLAAAAGMALVVVRWGNYGPTGQWLVVLAGAGHIFPLILLQGLFVVSSARIASRSAAVSLLSVLLAIGFFNYLLATATTVEVEAPFDRVRAPLVGVDPLAALAASPAFAAAWIGWLLTVLVGPVVAWRAVGRSTGAARRRLSVIAAASLLPVSVVGSCLIVLPTLVSSGLTEKAAIDALALAFGLLFPAALAAVLAALSLDEAKVREAARALERSLRFVVGLLVALGSVAAASVAAVALAGRSLALVVVATAAIVALAVPLHRVLARRLVRYADPQSAVTSAIVERAGAAARCSPALASRDALRTALADRDVEVAFRLPDHKSWVDAAGEEVQAPEALPAGHVTVVPDPEGRPQAYVRHRAHPTDAAGPIAAVSPLIDRATLEIAVRHQQQELAEERRRAERAAADERRRLERDLHDGLQARLIAIALELQAVEQSTADVSVQLALMDSLSMLRNAVSDLREIASGSAPETLAAKGLSAALDDLVRQMPVPISLSVPDHRLDPAVERTAYLVVSEAITNAVKHAGPCTVTVGIAVRDHVVEIRVADSGLGGADMRMGTGLRGLSERVIASGGTFLVSDRSPHGTSIEVVLPCGQ